MLYSNGLTIGVTSNPIKKSVYYVNNEDGGFLPPPGSEFIISETGDFVISETGDRMITE